MKTVTQTTISLRQLSNLPSFAAYLLQHRLDDFVDVQIRISEEVQLPILRFFKEYPQHEFLAIVRKGAADFLGYLSRNEAEQQIAQAVRQWKENQMPVINKYEVMAEDVTLVAYMRKQTFLYFIQDYCPTIEAAVELIREIDRYITTSETALSNTYIQLLKEKASENSLLIEKVNHTIPGAVYVFDLDQFKGIYSNNKLAQIIGYGHDELNVLAEKSITELLHPDDQESARKHLEDLKNTKDGEIKTSKYRIRGSNGNYRWLSNHESVFKRDENGRVIQTIGITLDVDSEQKAAEALRENENLYRQAEAITHLGNYTWNLKTKELKWSDELYRIYGLEPGSGGITSDQVKHFNHPEDDLLVEAAISTALQDNASFDFYYRIVTNSGIEKILHARGNLIPDASGEPVTILGTVQDETEKQTLIRQLRQSESVYKQAELLANMGNWSWDLKTGQIEWTDQLYRIYGLAPQSERMNIDRFLSFVHPNDRAYVQGGTGEDMSGNILDYTFRIITQDGRIKALRSVAQVYRDEEGKPLRIVGTERDITEKQHLIDRLQESEKLSRQAHTLARLGSWTLDIKTEKFSWSEEMYNIYELDPSEHFTITEWLQFVAPEDRDAVLGYYHDSLREKKIYDYLHRIILRNGKVKTIHRKAEFIYNEHGEAVKMIGTTQDVTDQVDAMEKIKEQEHFIQQIADASPTILYLYEVGSQSVQYINREIFFVLGYLPEEIIGAGASITEKLYHPEDHHLLPGRVQSDKTFQQVDSMIQYECRMRSKDGDWHWLLVREIVFKTDESGNIVQILGAALDINRRKEMEKTILQNTLLLEQSNASLEEFAYVASHDLKEPLRKISTFGDRLIASQLANLAPEGKVYLQKIVDASQRMQTMISDLLSISMITGNTSFEPYSLQAIFDETLQTLEHKIEQQNAIITADSLPEAKIIPSQFRQLFQNLLSNSLKFVQPGVQPRIEVRHRFLAAHDMVHYQLAVADGYQELKFSDNGIGFENEFAGKIFAIFQRLHGRSEYEGSGIGLAICKKIVEHHGGIIYAGGVPGEGSMFTIILPA